MDLFEQNLYTDIAENYAKDDVSKEDYEEIFLRLENLKYVPEVQPYLIAMRYMGYGVPAEKEKVMSELKILVNDGDPLIVGLYCDLLLLENKQNDSALEKIKEMVEKGYSDVYLKENSYLHTLEQTLNSLPESEPKEEKEEEIIVKSISFEGQGYSGYYFTSGDIDYLHANIYIEPVKARTHIIVSSQIYDGDKPFSKVFDNEYTIEPGCDCLATDGWGNRNFNGYDNRLYEWRITINGKNSYHQAFRFYTGQIDKYGIHLNDIKLFASKPFAADESDVLNYKTSFDASTLEWLYFRLFFYRQEEEKNIQIFLTVKYLEDGSILYNRYFLRHLNTRMNSCWDGIDCSAGGKWKKGRYQYIVSFEQGSRYEGTFNVY